MDTRSILELVIGMTVIIAIVIAGLILFVREYSKRVHTHNETLKRKEREKQSALLDATIEAQEGERARIGSDIHDDIGPLLSTLKLYVNRIKLIDDRDERNKYIDSLNNEMDSVISEIRRVAKDLVPVILVEFGLQDALENLCSRISQIEGLDAILILNTGMPALSKKEELAIYRICQEFCNNSVKYASASKIIIKILSSPITIQISDNGNGFDIGSVERDLKTGLGLKNMSARAQAINAEFSLTSADAVGTCATLTINPDKNVPTGQ